MRASVKAKRSRTVTDEEWWLRPMTTMGIAGREEAWARRRPVAVCVTPSGGAATILRSWIMKRREHVSTPKGQEHESETADCPERKAAPSLRKTPAHNDQTKV